MPKEHLTYKQIQDIKKKLVTIPIELGEHSQAVYEERYLDVHPDGTGETVEERLAAVAIDIASAELAYNSKYDVEKLATDIYTSMTSKKFMFNSPTIMHFGIFRKKKGKIVQQNQMGSACFVLPVADTMGSEEAGDGILDQVKYQGLIHKSGGGTGFSFARLRPSGSKIGYDPDIDGDSSIDWNSPKGVSSGPLSFLMYIYDAATNAIKQGNSRRGANMGVQVIDHPDVLDHIYAKMSVQGGNDYKVVNFNLSLAVTDIFMEAARKDGYYKLYNPHTGKYLVDSDVCSQERFEEVLQRNAINPGAPMTVPSIYKIRGSRDVVNAYTGNVIGFYDGEYLKISARTVLSEIAKLASSNGEPGVIFIDRMNEFNPTPDLGAIEATNPCGEQPLLPYEACNLGSINLSCFVNSNEESAELDWDLLSDNIKLLTRCLDNIIDRNDFPISRIAEAVTKTRKIGLGVMGFADMLYKMKIPYDSDKAVDLAEKVAKFISDVSRKESVKLAEEKGAFPAFKGSIFDKDSKNHLKGKAMKYNCVPRNAAITTVAPTGTISRLAETSSGIEPTFSLAYTSKIMGQEFMNVSNGFVETAKLEGFYSEELMGAIMANFGAITTNEKTDERIINELADIPQDYREVFQTAAGGDISTECHIQVQAAFQKYCDSSISKTAILPSGSGEEEVLKAYFMAWETGCKGITVYVDKSRAIQVLNTLGGVPEDAVDYNYHRPLAQVSFTVEIPFGNPLKSIGEYETDSEVVFTTIAFDPEAKKVNSIFQNTSYGNSHEIIHLITENKAWSKILKRCDGNLKELETELARLPSAHHEGSETEDGTMRTKVTNDTTPNAALKTIYFIKYITNCCQNWSHGGMSQRWSDYRNGSVTLKEIIKFKGEVKIEEEKGNPSIFPKNKTIHMNSAAVQPKVCPYCRTASPPYHLSEGCVMYDCCSTGKCG